MITFDLKSSFMDAARGAGGRVHLEDTYAQLLGAYGQPHRAYHTLTHIEHGARELLQRRDSLRAPHEVMLAYWFHDAVYAQGPLATNEADSARLARTACIKMGIPEAVGERLAAWILCTKSHVLPAGTAWGDDPDLETLLDIDLSILASDRYTLACFERDVKFEYNWVPFEALYLSSRRKVLESFLGRPYLYQRPALHARFERAARANLGHVITQLREDAPLVVEATARHIFRTQKGRLVDAHPWPEVSYVSASREAGGPRVHAFVGFGTYSDRGFTIELGAPENEGVLGYLRGLPGYRLDAETHAGDSAVATLLFRAAASGTPPELVQSAYPETARNYRDGE